MACRILAGSDRGSDRAAQPAGNLAPMAYEVHTDVFEGPFDLLFRLITEQRVDLYEVALADIVDAFLAEVEAMQYLDLEIATEFLVIAATLVELKCRRLLPGRDGELDPEHLALLEERDYLLARLVECTTFSAAGARLAALELAASRSWPRLAGPDERFEGLQPELLGSTSSHDLREAAERALAPRPESHVEVDHVLVDEVTVAQVVEALVVSLPGRSPTTFHELTVSACTRMEVVVHFLGLLELYKQGLIELDQAVTFGDLAVVWIGGLQDQPQQVSEVLGASGPSVPVEPSVTVSLGDLEYQG